MQFEDGLYGASAGALLERLRRLAEPVETVLLIGHNPGMQELTVRLDRPGARRYDLSVKFPTCALATLETVRPLEAARGARGAGRTT